MLKQRAELVKSSMQNENTRKWPYKGLVGGKPQEPAPASSQATLGEIAP